jgi:branched-chain amino acid transport system substrate-binding protein
MSVVGVDIKRGAELGVEQLGTALTEMGFKIELAPFESGHRYSKRTPNRSRSCHFVCGLYYNSEDPFIRGISQCRSRMSANTNPKSPPALSGSQPHLRRDDVQGVVVPISL